VKSLIKLYPKLEKEILTFENDFKDLKKLIKIVPPPQPTHNKKKDIPISLKHFINVTQLRLITQMSLIKTGLKSQNPEVFSIVRATMETIAAMAFVSDRVESEYLAKNYNKAWSVVTKAFMGRRTKIVSFGKNEEIKEGFEKSVNVMTYIDKANSLISNKLKKLNRKKKKEHSNFFKFQYELISEFTHPNYNALEMYWKIADDEVVYQKPSRVLTSESLGVILHALSPLIPIYLLFLKRAHKFHQELTKK
jgi:hypothetical protein